VIRIEVGLAANAVICGRKSFESALVHPKVGGGISTQQACPASDGSAHDQRRNGGRRPFKKEHCVFLDFYVADGPALGGVRASIALPYGFAIYAVFSWYQRL
jgi:hypothetical protein